MSSCIQKTHLVSYFLDSGSAYASGPRAFEVPEPVDETRGALGRHGYSPFAYATHFSLSTLDPKQPAWRRSGPRVPGAHRSATPRVAWRRLGRTLYLLGRGLRIRQNCLAEFLAWKGCPRLIPVPQKDATASLRVGSLLPAENCGRHFCRRD